MFENKEYFLGKEINVNGKMVKIIGHEGSKIDSKMTFVIESDIYQGYALSESKFIGSILDGYEDCENFDWIENDKLLKFLFYNQKEN